MIGDLLPVSQKQIDSYAGAEGYKKELSQQEVEASPERKRKAQQGQGSSMERQVQARLAQNLSSRPPVPTFPPVPPPCLNSDDEHDDETFHLACTLTEKKHSEVKGLIASGRHVVSPYPAPGTRTERLWIERHCSVARDPHAP